MEGRKLTFLLAAVAVLLLAAVTTVDGRNKVMPFSDVQHRFATVRKDGETCFLGGYCDESVGAYCCESLMCFYYGVSIGMCVERP
ncbi:solute carrier family 5 (sodium/glucose cotransporter), member 2 [Corchorus olitorius]|uniref:Solute carrier family 5 (Sodium/glucose cotransporter), member 2 n=1 Tax=Corchorus olitorius TaxID=93759 RepID=A0A1R3KWG3_9ROSI|nr:solute carrier family 5 (sodium/glucose cotransporter), member 2 [Corchorus olitorius]